MSNGAEATQSITVQAYFKGFSMLITSRDKDIDLEPMIDEQIALINKLIEKGCNPSWNEETNKQAIGTKPVQQTFSSVSQAVGRLCPSCGGNLINARKRNGEGYIKCEHNIYQNGQQTGCTYVEWKSQV